MLLLSAVLAPHQLNLYLLHSCSFTMSLVRLQTQNQSIILTLGHPSAIFVTVHVLLQMLSYLLHNCWYDIAFHSYFPNRTLTQVFPPCTAVIFQCCPLLSCYIHSYFFATKGIYLCCHPPSIAILSWILCSTKYNFFFFFASKELCTLILMSLSTSINCLVLVF